MSKEILWVGIELDPERPSPHDDARHGIITRLFSRLEELGYTLQAVPFSDGASVNRLAYEGETLLQVFRTGDSRRIGFGWEVDCTAEGVEKLNQVKQMLKALDLDPEFVSVYAWTPPTAKPEELVSVMAKDIEA